MENKKIGFLTTSKLIFDPLRFMKRIVQPINAFMMLYFSPSGAFLQRIH